MIIEGTPVPMCIDIIRKYIFEKKGVIVNINPVVQPQDEGKFITALNIACQHFNIEL